MRANAEICDQHPAVTLNQYVRGVKIQVQHPHPVRVIESISHLQGDRDSNIYFQPRPYVEQVAQ